jgi:ribonucleotide reductase beta subunit family protein with ferritin-like domain
MDITKPRYIYKPFEYEQAYKYWKTQQTSHWLAQEANLNQDVMDWNFSLTESERKVLGQILKSFVQSEIHVEDYWSTKVMKWFPKPEIQMMAATFAAFESIHIDAYDSLNAELKLDDYEAFLTDQTAVAKLQVLKDVKGNSKKDIARSLAIFSGFTEGVNLFSSFAILANMARFGLMRGVKNIIDWSRRDECLVEGHEVLTPTGWVDLKDFDVNTMEVAQFDNANKQITFTKASRKVEYDVDEEIIEFSGTKRPFSQAVTKNHRLPYSYRPNGVYKGSRDIKAINFSNNSHNYLLLSGELQGRKSKLSSFDKFCIMTQADGSISDRYTGEICGTRPVSFSFSKERKIERFIKLVGELKFNYKELPPRKAKGNVKKQRKFIVDVPMDYFNRVPDMKRLTWVDYSDISSDYAKEFLMEVVEWDGHKASDSRFYYSSVIKENVDTVATLTHLCGMSAKVYVQVDNRSENFSDVHRVTFSEMDEKQGKGVDKNFIHYKGKVRCITVPTGFFLTRYKGNISVTGNCIHSEAGCWLFRTFIKENPSIWDDELKRDIYEAARLSVKLEDDFIDNAFSLGEIRGLEPSHLKSFIRNRANYQLRQLGLKNNWKNINQEDLAKMDWFELLQTSISNTDFFSTKVTEYAKVGWKIEEMFDVKGE